MKLKQFLDHIHHHTKDIPNKDNLEVIFSIDDEGNEFKKVYFEPTLCKIENVDSKNVNIVGFYEDNTIKKENINSICIT